MDLEREETKKVKRVGVLMAYMTVLLLGLGINAYAQQQAPSSQKPIDQEQQQKTSKQESNSSSTTTSPNSTQQETPSNPSAETASTLQGVMLASDTIIGATVKNDKGEEIGQIQRLHISPKYGVVLYAELSVGGFLGMGDKTMMVPWKSIEIARSGDSLVLNTSKQLLKQATE